MEGFFRIYKTLKNIKKNDERFLFPDRGPYTLHVKLYPLMITYNDYSMVVPLLKVFLVYASVVSYVTFMFLLNVPHFLFIWCLGRDVLSDCSISWYLYLYVYIKYVFM